MIYRIDYDGFSVSETELVKTLRSKDANYNFNKETGEMVTWGSSLLYDADRFPAPTILDMEVTTICKGVNGVLCPFCFPAETGILTSQGIKNIDDIKIGDVVISKNIESGLKVENEVLEVYKRLYEGIMITIELEDGTKIETTPEHPIFVKDKGWVLAKDLTEDIDIEIV